MLGIGATLIATAAVVLLLVLRPSAGEASGSEPPSTLTAQEPSSAAGPEPRSAADPRSTRRTASASCVRPPGRDAGGDVSSYGPELALDGRPETAWRCNGDGARERFTVDFAEPVVLTAFGIIPGFAKTDPYDGTDRFAQNDRLSAVTLTFDADAPVILHLDTSPVNRQMQAFRISSVVTRQVVITIDASEPGSLQGSQPPIDAVAISEVAFA
jgi:hypothetical protein